MAEDFDFGFTAVDEPEDRGTPAPVQPSVNNDEVLDEIKKLEAKLGERYVPGEGSKWYCRRIYQERL